MAKKNDFVKRADDLLAARRTAVALLDTRNEQAAALADTDANIDKAVATCLDAGWKPDELTEIGVPKTALPRRQARSATLAPRRPATAAAADPAPPVDTPNPTTDNAP